jgi:hypothetical protein
MHTAFNSSTYTDFSLEGSRRSASPQKNVPAYTEFAMLTSEHAISKACEVLVARI